MDFHQVISMQLPTKPWGNHVWYSLKEYLNLRRTKFLSDLSAYASYGAVEPIDPFDPLVVGSPSGSTSSTFASQRNTDMSIFPNPVTENYFYVNAVAPIKEQAIAVFDQMGRKLPIQVQNNYAGEYRIEFVTEPLPGLYIIRAGEISKRLLVQ
jgi:hypothetical protein